MATNLRQGRILKTDTTKEDAEIGDSSRYRKLHRRHSAISHFVIFRKHYRNRFSNRHAGGKRNRMFHNRSDFGNCRTKRSCKSRSETVSDSGTVRRFHHILHIHERSVPHGPRRIHRYVSRIHNGKHCRRIHTALCRTCRSKAIMSISTKRCRQEVTQSLSFARTCTIAYGKRHSKTRRTACLMKRAVCRMSGNAPQKIRKT